MRSASLVLLLANVVYGTSYIATRLALDAVPPAPLAWRQPRPAGQEWRMFWMGVVGFSAAFALTNWGIHYSSATNAALLIIVEPLTLLALGPLILGERLT